MRDIAMQKHLTIDKMAPTTGRTGERLAVRHGYESLSQFAETLPSNAQVLDVGAGVSDFGKTVADLRSDVTWINYDYSYQDPRVLRTAKQDAPDNVRHIFGDARHLRDVYRPDSFDAVLSYWMVPHLSMDDDISLARDAVKAMFDVTKPGGLISIGPMWRRRGFGFDAADGTYSITKGEDTDRDQFVNEAIEVTRLGKWNKFANGFYNEVVTPTLGTSLHTEKGEWRLPLVYDQKSGEYVSPASRRGCVIIGQLAMATARHVSKWK